MTDQSTTKNAAPGGTCAADGSVWIPTHKPTGRIDKLAEVVFFKDDIDFEGNLSSDWEWREYRLLPVTSTSNETNR